ncbi:RNA pol II accessory factor, Cdc73 family-domain-containing protein [Lophiotrema nucula]|uniref:RNA pol II accessory factor, Cdc73 family-domain-containing protein n=1 Tax=Lophiotrema nucula TaxID=690887 RepID=A0A6A5Z1C3_9PLEO|nr:RNA pol II accessory factor, Cdc73 family-domain-containing protein [Lophiotrema nucula]
MASQPPKAELEDPLSNLRLSIKHASPPVLANSPDPSSSADVVDKLSQATHISFTIAAPGIEHSQTFEITTPTRFKVNDQNVNLRDVYFAWLNKDSSLADYIAAVTDLNEELPSGAGGSVQNLSFAQKIELIGWLSGEVESSDSIDPLGGAAGAAAAADSAAIAGGKGVPFQQNGGTVSTAGGKMVDARLLQIYDGERKMGDHNTVLRGAKPTDFSNLRQTAKLFFKSGNTPNTANPTNLPSRPLPPPSKPSRRHEQPIILLSPSPSSLVSMANSKQFLDEGVYIPPGATDASSTNMVQLNRIIPSIDPARPLRFILVDSTQNFKPTYWPRVVAIFTTGQTWQFKSYKYTNPAELFSHYPGVYVGWQGEEPPENVGQLGRGVLSVKVDKWTGNTSGRWRDREVVEMIWGRIEEGMRRRGWTRDGPGLSGSGSGR